MPCGLSSLLVTKYTLNLESSITGEILRSELFNIALIFNDFLSPIPPVFTCEGGPDSLICELTCIGLSKKIFSLGIKFFLGCTPKVCEDESLTPQLEVV